MQEQINEKVSIISKYDRSTGVVMPVKMRWQGRDYLLSKLAYHHKVRQGRVVFHIFHVTDGSMDFKLQFDPDTMHWLLVELTDGSTT